MNMLQQLASQTPVWVWLLLAFLVTRGIAAMKPAETSLHKLAVVPALFAVWGAWSVSHRFGASLSAFGEWLAGIATGATLAAAAESIEADAGSQHRQALAQRGLQPAAAAAGHLPVKYGFEVAFAVSPSLTASAGFSAAYLLLTGGFTGIFVGKYGRYLASLRMDAAGKGLETAG